MTERVSCDRNHLHGARDVREDRLCLANASRSSVPTSSSSSSDVSSALSDCGSSTVIGRTRDFGGDSVCRSFAANGVTSSAFTFLSPASSVSSALPSSERTDARGSPDFTGAILSNCSSSLSRLYAMIGSSSSREEAAAPCRMQPSDFVTIRHQKGHPPRDAYRHVHYTKGRAFPADHDLDKDGTSLQRIEALEAQGTRHDAIVYILVFVATLVLAVYLMVFCLFMTRPERSQGRELGSRSPGQGEERALEAPCAPKVTCISQREVRKAARVIKRNHSEESESLMELLPTDYQVRDEQICFQGDGWLHKWAAKLGEIYAEVLETVDYIKDKQVEINQTINVSNNPSQPSSQPTTGKYPVFAHFLLDIEESSKGQGELTVLKLDGVSMQSAAYGVHFTNSTGELKILHNGFYFLYSYVVFRGNNSPKHEVIKKQMSKTEKLQEGESTSALQGVFRLHKGDSVYVQASRSQLDASGSQGSYFGLYLVRT